MFLGGSSLYDSPQPLYEILYWSITKKIDTYDL